MSEGRASVPPRVPGWVAAVLLSVVTAGGAGGGTYALISYRVEQADAGVTALEERVRELELGAARVDEQRRAAEGAYRQVESRLGGIETRLGQIERRLPEPRGGGR